MTTRLTHQCNVSARSNQQRWAQGEFKQTAYYAECVDLLRKFMLSGLVSLLAPGTVIQSFVTALFSLVFMVIHALMCKLNYSNVSNAHTLLVALIACTTDLFTAFT